MGLNPDRSDNDTATIPLGHSCTITAISKVALNASNQELILTVYSYDSYILCLLIHHVNHASNPPDIFLANIDPKKENQKRECLNINDVDNNFDHFLPRHLVFANAFTGCNTISAIHNFVWDLHSFNWIAESNIILPQYNLFSKNYWCFCLPTSLIDKRKLVASGLSGYPVLRLTSSSFPTSKPSGFECILLPKRAWHFEQDVQTLKFVTGVMVWICQER